MAIPLVTLNKVIRPLPDMNIRYLWQLDCLRDRRGLLQLILDDPASVAITLIDAEAYSRSWIEAVSIVGFEEATHFSLGECDHDEMKVRGVRQSFAKKLLSIWLTYAHLPPRLPDGTELMDIQCPDFKALISIISQASPWWLVDMLLDRALVSDYAYDIRRDDLPAIRAEIGRHIEAIDRCLAAFDGFTPLGSALSLYQAN